IRCACSHALSAVDRCVFLCDRAKEWECYHLCTEKMQLVNQAKDMVCVCALFSIRFVLWTMAVAAGGVVQGPPRGGATALRGGTRTRGRCAAFILYVMSSTNSVHFSSPSRGVGGRAAAQEGEVGRAVWRRAQKAALVMPLLLCPDDSNVWA